MRNKFFTGVLLALLIMLFVLGIILFLEFFGEKGNQQTAIKTAQNSQDAKKTDEQNSEISQGQGISPQQPRQTQPAKVAQTQKNADEKKQVQQSKLTGAGTIAGVVYYQEFFENPSGGQNYGGPKTPLKDVTVRLLDKVHLKYGMASQITEVKTDEKGEFKIEKIPTGEFTLQVEKSGYATKLVGNYRIRKNESFYVEIIMGKGFDIFGIVKNKKGEPLEGAQVLAIKIQPEQIFYNPAKTDKEGKYLISGLTKGLFYIQASHPDYASAKKIKRLSQTQEIDFKLKVGGGIRGVVYDPDGLPVTKFKAKAYLFAQAPQNVFLSSASAISQTFENPAGTFEISGLKPDTYCLEVYTDQYAMARVPNIKVVKNQFTDVVVNLKKGATLVGKVLEKESKKPVADARVSLADYAVIKFSKWQMEIPNPFVDSRDFATYTDEQGNFIISGIPLKKRQVWVTHPDYPQLKENVDFSKGGEIQHTFYLEALTARVHGVVKDARGNPCKGYRVAMMPAGGRGRRGGGPMGAMGTMLNTSAITDDAGKYEIKNIKPGKYMMMVVRGLISFQEMTTLNIKAGDDLEVNFGIEGGVIVVGTVKLKGKALKNAVVSFTPLNPRAQFRTASTNESGYYEVGGIVPGRYAVLVVYFTNFRNPLMSRFSVEVPDVKEFRFDIDIPVSTVTGVVKSKVDGKPVKGGRVFLEASESKGDASNITELMSIFGGQARIDQNGKFKIKNVASAIYRIRIYADGYSTKFIDNIRVKPNVEVNMGTIYVNSETKLSGIVTDELGSPIKGAVVTVKDENGVSLTMFFGARTDKNGKFTLSGLSEGKFYVSAVAPGYQKNTVGPITIGAENVVDVEIKLKGACSINIQVQDTNDNGIPNALVEIKDEQGKKIPPQFFLPSRGANFGNINPYLTDAAGRLKRDNLSPGTYTIEVSKAGFVSKSVKITLTKGVPSEVTVILPPK